MWTIPIGFAGLAPEWLSNTMLSGSTTAAAEITWLVSVGSA